MHEPSPGRRGIERALALGGLLFVLASAAFFVLGRTGDPERGLEAPVEERAALEPEASANLARPDSIAAKPSPEGARSTARTAVEAAPVESDLAAEVVGTGTIEGLFHLPGDLPRDAALSIQIRRRPAADETSSPTTTHTSEPGAPWSITNLPAAEWRLCARASHGARSWSSEAAEVELAEGAHVRGITLRLIEYRAEGVVTDRRGFPLAGVEVRLDWQDQEAPLIFEGEYEDRSIALMGSLPLVKFFFEPESTEEEAAIFREDLALDLAEMMSAAERRGSTLEISISNEPGIIETDGIQQVGPVIEFSESITDAPIDEPFAPTPFLTDVRGRYSIPLPGPGRFGLSVHGEAPRLLAEDAQLVVDPLQPIGRADFEVVRASFVRGRVTLDARVPLEDVRCFLRLGQETDVVTCDENGDFAFGSVWPGRHFFYARAGGERGQDFSEHLMLEVEEGAQMRVDVRLLPSFEVTGLVLDENEQRFAGARVLARSIENLTLTRECNADANGRFVVRGLYPGEYRLEVRAHALSEPAVFFVDSTSPPAEFTLRASPHRPKRPTAR